MRPFGRTININTINKYGNTGAVWAMVKDANAESAESVTPSGASMLAKE